MLILVVCKSFKWKWFVLIIGIRVFEIVFVYNLSILWFKGFIVLLIVVLDLMLKFNVFEWYGLKNCLCIWVLK